MSSTDRPGHEWKYLWLVDLIKVGLMGQNMDICKYCASFFVEA